MEAIISIKIPHLSLIERTLPKQPNPAKRSMSGARAGRNCGVRTNRSKNICLGWMKIFHANIQLIRRKGVKFSAFTPFRDFLKKYLLLVLYKLAE